MDADILIVGGGSAGSVLAGRLSARGDRRVVLVEAGRDLPPGQEPAAIRDIYPIHAAFDPRNHWPGLSATLQPVPHNAPDRPPQVRYEQARIMGGGSSINGQIAVRGTPDDYERWAELGAAGWGWRDVLPVFRRMERDLDFGGPEHGDSGPLVIHRVPRDRWPGGPSTPRAMRISATSTGAMTMAGSPCRSPMTARTGCPRRAPISTTRRGGGPICASSPTRPCAV
jgi:5-(hydroxymethyl)furfural/furfural oxidase